MNKIDKLCTELIREGRITLIEALAIGASVRFITILDHPARQEFVCLYGTEARDNCFNLLQSPIKGDNHIG